MYWPQNATSMETTTGNEGVPANGNHKCRQKKTKRAAKVNVVIAHCPLALDVQVLITTDVMRRLKPKNIALGPARKLSLTNESNTLHTDTLRMDVWTLFPFSSLTITTTSVIPDLHSSFCFSATLTVLLATCCIHYAVFVLINRCI